MHEAISELFKAVAAPAGSLREISRVLMAHALKLTNSQAGFVGSIEPGTGDHLAYTFSAGPWEVWAADGDQEQVRFRRGADGRYPGLWGHALNTREAFYTNSAPTHDSARGVPERHPPIESFLGVPALLEEEVVGQVALANRRDGFTEREVRTVTQLAKYYALAIQRIRFEEALRFAEEQHRMALEAGQLGTWDYDLQTGLIAWDKRCRTLFGVPGDVRVTYETAIGRIHAADRRLVDEAVKRATDPDGSGRYAIEYRVVRDEGSVRWIAALGQVHFAEKGGRRVPARFIGTVQDISERKALDAELEQAWAALEQKVVERTSRLQQVVERLRREVRVRREAERQIKGAELRYRTVADFTYDWESWRGPNGDWIYCSPACQRVTGYTPEEFVSNPGLLSRLVLPEDAKAWSEHQKQAFGERGAQPIEFRIRHKDGTTRWIEHVCRPVTGPKGEFIGIRASHRDITARKQVDQETQTLREQLSRASRITMAGQLSASLAHELNQPLGAILINAQAAEFLLNQDKPDLEEARLALKEIRADSQRAGEVIQGLRRLFQRTGGERTEVRLEGLIQETVKLIKSEFVNRSIRLEIKIEPDVPAVSGNNVKLQQVVLNLLMNAMEAMETTEPEQRELRVQLEREDTAWVRVTVRDKGKGLAPGQIERLFEPFFTTKGAGMGMGLAIASSIIEYHGGRLWAENNPERGASFHFRLPVWVDSRQPK